MNAPMPQPPHMKDTAQPAFWLNPNVVSRIQSGFKAALQRPLQLRDPDPEFALTVPGDPTQLDSAARPHDGR